MHFQLLLGEAVNNDLNNIVSKMADILQNTFSDAFHWIYVLYFDWNITKMSSHGAK